MWVVNIETGQTLGFCKLEEGVQEIFAVEVLPGLRFPDLVNHDAELIGRSYVLGDAALAEVPKELRNWRLQMCRAQLARVCVTFCVWP